MEAIGWAYDLRVHQSAELERKAPLWVTQECYDIEAKSKGAVTEAQCRQMVQKLLADRFKIVIHLASRQGEVYDLVTAPWGIQDAESN